MKKRMIGITALAAVMTAATGMTAFAAGWKQDTHGWYYEYDNGAWAPCGWFTDPETKNIYYLDPDGYMMSGTRMEGYWLDDSGVRHEKTEAEKEAEAKRKERVASRPNPGKEQVAADNAAKAAKTATTAVGTKRLVYQHEIDAFSNRFYTETAKALGTSSLGGRTTRNNLETTLKFVSHDNDVLVSRMPLVATEKSANYVPYAWEFIYNRNVLNDEREINAMNGVFKNLLIAGLGETQGNAVYERVMAEPVGQGGRFELSGNTDTGNSYSLNYAYERMTLQVICSEYDPEAEAAAAKAAEEAAAKAAEEAAQEAANTTSVITAGAGQSSQPETAAADTAEEDAAENAGEGENAEGAGDGAADGSATEAAGEDTGAADNGEGAAA